MADEYFDLDLSDEELGSLDTQFSQAANHLKSLVSQIESKKLLELYSYYKQGTEGPCHTERPRWFDAQGKMKWDAWHALGDLPSDDAKKSYISLIKELDPCFATESGDGRGKTVSSWAAVSTLSGEEEDVAEADKTIVDLSREGRADCITNLLKAQPDLANIRDSDGLFPIHWAADRGHSNVVVAIIECCGAQVVEQTDSTGQTPLHYAAACGHVDVVRSLLAAGATMRCDHEGDTPLDAVTDSDVKKLLQLAD